MDSIKKELKSHTFTKIQARGEKNKSIVQGLMIINEIASMIR